MTAMPLRAIVLAAVSTLGQAEDDKFSIPAQIEDGQRIAADILKAEVIDTLVVPGHSRSKHRTLEGLAESALKKLNTDAYYRLIKHLDVGDFEYFIMRDANRIARKASLFHYVIECITEDVGARIYSMADGGLIADEQLPIWAMMKGYTGSEEVRRLQGFFQRGMDERLKQGRSTSPNIPAWLMRVRDPETGEELRLEHNPHYARYWQDLATLFLEGVRYNLLDSEMYRRFGHVDESGQPHERGTARRMLFNPRTWGHAARHGWGKDGPWIYDESIAPPDGVKVARNIGQPVYSGAQAEAIKAEIRRRSGIQGKRSPNDTYRFSGLCRCASCGRTLGVYRIRGGTKRGGVHCPWYEGLISKTPACTHRAVVPARNLEAFVTERLLKPLNEGLALPAMLSVPVDTTASDRRELAKIISQIENVIREQSMADIKVAASYRSVLAELADRRDILQQRIDDAARNLARIRHTAQQRENAAEIVRQHGPDGFWLLSDREINQALHSLLTGFKIECQGPKPIGLRPV